MQHLTMDRIACSRCEFWCGELATEAGVKTFGLLLSDGDLCWYGDILDDTEREAVTQGLQVRFACDVIPIDLRRPVA